MRHAMRDKRHEKYRRGVTLLEMMIVLGLIIVLTSAATVYNRGIGRQIAVAREHAKVLGILVKARSAGFAILKGDTPGSVCGYGVHVEPSTRTLIFFKDLCASANYAYDVGERIDEVVLDPSLTVTSDVSNIVFIPPFGNVLIDNTDTKVTATITITSASAGVTKKVTVNSYGQITE